MRRTFILILCPILLIFAPYALMKLGENADPFTPNVEQRYTPPTKNTCFGTDSLGRNMVARTIYALGLSLKVAVVSSGISLLLSLILGGIAGYYHKRFPDKIISWLFSFIYTIPMILIIAAIFAVIEPGIERTYIALGCIGWVAPARLVRAEVIQLQKAYFVLSERAFGLSELTIFKTTILPLCFQSALISLLYYLPELIGIEVGLSLFGLSAQPPIPTLGGLIYDGIKEFPGAWWLAIIPATLLLLIMVSLNIALHIYVNKLKGFNGSLLEF